jgi:nucleotide-binding universal stress UspA family protein
MVAAVAYELCEAGLDAEGSVVPGTPQDALLDEANRWDADSFFLGSQGFNALDRSMLGRVASAVAARAACSVEVSRS